MKFNIQEIAGATRGQIIQATASEFDSFHIDSRKIAPGGLFFALKGETTDGHLFVEDAWHRGAGGVIVDSEIPRLPITIIRAQNTFTALHDLARYARKKTPVKFIGITGSSGKTSTKEFTATLLAETFSVFKSEGNLNSITGLPLSLLSMEPREWAVFEVAMNKPGEISALSSLLQPDIGVLLNVNPVHIGQFPSLDAVADEKCSLLTGMPEDGIVIYNLDDPLIAKRVHNAKPRKVTFGTLHNADLRISELRLRGVRGVDALFVWRGQKNRIHTDLCGTGNIYNIAAAACTALTLGMEMSQVAAAASKLQPYRQRGVLIEAGEIHIYDDSYNSNPRALEIALQLIQQSDGYRRKVAVLGDMLELGANEQMFHQRAGEQIAAAHFDLLITAGPLSRYMAESARKGGVQVHEAVDSDDAAEKTAQLVQAGDLVLVKGSRGMKMERVVESLATRTIC